MIQHSFIWWNCFVKWAEAVGTRCTEGGGLTMAMAQFSAIKWWLRLPSKSVCRTVYHYDFDYYLKNVCLHAFNLAFWRIYRRRLQMERPTEKVIMIRSNSHAISVPPLHVDSYISFLSSGKNHSLVSVRYRLVGFRLTDIVLTDVYQTIPNIFISHY